jgi:hypothetical protein
VELLRPPLSVNVWFDRPSIRGVSLDPESFVIPLMMNVTAELDLKVGRDIQYYVKVN